MKAIVIAPQNSSEYQFISDLLKKHGISSSTMTKEQMEDLGLSKMLKGTNRSKKISRKTVMNKLKL